LVIEPGTVLVRLPVSGVSPAQEHSASAERNRVTSPISATRMAATLEPIPLIAWNARYPQWPAPELVSS
jgi:hypothetical protein